MKFYFIKKPRQKSQHRKYVTMTYGKWNENFLCLHNRVWRWWKGWVFFTWLFKWRRQKHENLRNESEFESEKLEALIVQLPSLKSRRFVIYLLIFFILSQEFAFTKVEWVDDHLSRNFFLICAVVVAAGGTLLE